MNDTVKINPALASDPAKINFYGAPQQQLDEYQQSLKSQIDALEKRYENPNYFRVAAGFLKPQLGGFSASLGSASEALGENVEAQRAAALPIAQMRAQLAQSNILMGQNKTASDLVKAYEAKNSPLHELPDLVAKLTELGSPIAAGPKARLDEARKTQQTAIERANLIRAQNEQEIGKINADLASKAISIAEAQARRNALPKIPSVPDLFANPDLVEKEQAKANAPSAEVASANKPEIAPPVAPKPIEEKKPVEKTLIKPVLNLNDEVGDTQTTIASRAQMAVDYGKQGNEIYNTLRSTAGPESYNDNVVPIQNALKLLGYGEKDPKIKADLESKSKKVMNVLSGDAWNAFLTALNTGVGGKVGDLYAQINLPIEQFVRAKFPPELQDYARDLAQNLAQASIVRQRLSKINPSSARNVELHLYGEASPTLNATPLSAMKNLLHLHTSFDQLRDMYNFIEQVDLGQHPKYEVDPKNQITRIFDITRSEGYKDIGKEYLKQHQELEKATRGRN
jgi:hypothetical protein